MKKGTIILVRYKYDPIGFLIRILIKSRWNHAVWCINNQCILEAKGGGIYLVPFTKFKNNRLFEYKILNITISNKKLDRALDFAYKKVGTKHNYFKFLLALWTNYLTKKPLKILTCSGLIATALSKVEYYFRKDKHPSKITPEDINRYVF